MGSNFYLNLKPSELRSLCHERQLLTTGTRNQLIQRLNAHDVERGCDDDTTRETQVIPFDGRGYDPARLIGIPLRGYFQWDNQMRLDLTNGETVSFRITQTSMSPGGEAQGTHVSEPILGTDLNLRKALENMLGQIYRGGPPTRIINACIAVRTSLRRNPTLPVGEWRENDEWYLRNPPVKHRVIGLQLEGMHKMGYVYCWDKRLVTKGAEGDAFCDVELGSLEAMDSAFDEDVDAASDEMSLDDESGREEHGGDMDLDTPSAGMVQPDTASAPEVRLSGAESNAGMRNEQVRASTGVKRKLPDEEASEERAHKFRSQAS